VLNYIKDIMHILCILVLIST